MKKKKIIFVFVFFVILQLINCNEKRIVKITTERREEVFVTDEEVQFKVYKDNTVIVVDLEKVKNIKRVIFDMTSEIEKDFKFLSPNNNLEEVIISSCIISNFDFIKELPNLKALIIRGCDIVDKSIDLINNKNIEYLEIECCNLTILPKLINIPKTLKFINLSFNDIKIVDKYDYYYYEFNNVIKSVEKVIFYKNKSDLKKISNSKFYFEKADNIVPSKYRNYGVSS